MKIEVLNVNFAGRQLEHVTSSGMKTLKMKGRGVEALVPVLAYIEDYADQNGFTMLNGTSAGNNVQFFLIK